MFFFSEPPWDLFGNGSRSAVQLFMNDTLKYGHLSNEDSAVLAT